MTLTGWRLIVHPHAVAEDFTDARRGFGFFTTVAGTNVLGVRLAMDGHYAITAVLFAISGLMWLVLGYVIPWTAVLGNKQRPVVAAANGTWFIWVVASQSVAVAAATLEPIYDDQRRVLAIVAVFSWSVGIFLYGAAGFCGRAHDALRTAAGRSQSALLGGDGRLRDHRARGRAHRGDGRRAMVAVTRGLIAGVAVVFWAFATWLIPALVAAPGHLASLGPPCSVELRGDAVEHHLPAGHVRGGRIYLGRADRLPIVRGHRQCRAVDRVHRLDSGDGGHARESVPHRTGRSRTRPGGGEVTSA